jgi:hypothetical protein
VLTQSWSTGAWKPGCVSSTNGLNYLAPKQINITDTKVWRRLSNTTAWSADGTAGNLILVFNLIGLAGDASLDTTGNFSCVKGKLKLESTTPMILPMHAQRQGSWCAALIYPQHIF